MNKQLILAVLSILLISMAEATSIENISTNQSQNEPVYNASALYAGQDEAVDNGDASDAGQDEPVDGADALQAGQDEAVEGADVEDGELDKQSKDADEVDAKQDKKGDDTSDPDEDSSILTADQEKENGNPNPGLGIKQPNSKMYENLSAEWWKWELSMPMDAHPLNDTADASEGQSGKVWFLGSNLTTETVDGEAVAIVDRDCTIPPGTKIFIPLFNIEGSTIEGMGESETELREYTDWIMNRSINPIEMSAEIDGVSVENLEQYVSPSSLFAFGPLPENNPLQSLGVDAPAGTVSNSVADGYYLLIQSLPPGVHTIHLSSTYMIPEFDFVFTQDITYTVTVEPGKDKGTGKSK